MEAQKGSVPSIKKRAAAGVRFRFVRVAAVDAHIDVLADEALQRSAPGRSGVNVKVLVAVRIRAGWNKPLLRPDKIDSWVLIGRRRETQVIQLHERIAFKGKLDALEPANFTHKRLTAHARSNQGCLASDRNRLTSIFCRQSSEAGSSNFAACRLRLPGLPWRVCFMFKGSSYLLVRHEQRHSFRVSWIDMTVSVQDPPSRCPCHSAITFISTPLSIARVMNILLSDRWVKFGKLKRRHAPVSAFFASEILKIRSLFDFPSQSFEKRPHLRKDRNGKACARLVAIRNDAPSIKIDIEACQRASLSLAKSSQPEKFQKICAVLGIGVENFPTNICDDRLKLLKCWRQSDWFLALG